MESALKLKSGCDLKRTCTATPEQASMKPMRGHYGKLANSSLMPPLRNHLIVAHVCDRVKWQMLMTPMLGVSKCPDAALL